ncbi:MAG TPA: DUF1849 family protein [Terriglobia bacterium]|nr:DUF1849 family protein [Terriglobia bacterium]
MAAANSLFSPAFLRDFQIFRIRPTTVPLAAWLLVSAALAWATPGVQAAEILPHKAIYTLHNREAVGDNDSLSADGMLIFEWMDTCDGWQVNQRAKLRLVGDQGETDFEWRQITWEAKDGRSYRYQSQEFQDGQKGEQRQGEVSLDDKGVAQLTMAAPEHNQSALPAGILLPTAHSMRLLKAATTGETYVSADVFDGTVSDKPMQIGAAIAPSPSQAPDQAKEFPPLAHVASHVIDLAFYLKDGDPAGLPDFEQSMRLYDNGVIGHMSFPFAGVDMIGDLVKLDAVPPGKCKAATVSP